MSAVQLTIDLRAVAYISFYYKNQHGDVRRTKPRHPTVRGMTLSNPDAFARAHHDYPNETQIERARRLELLDIWTPICKYHMRNNHSLGFKGEEAKKRQATYNKHIYGKNNNYTYMENNTKKKLRVTITSRANIPIGYKVLLVKQPANEFDNEAIAVRFDNMQDGFVSAYYKTRQPNTIGGGRIYDLFDQNIEGTVVAKGVVEVEI